MKKKIQTQFHKPRMQYNSPRYNHSRITYLEIRQHQNQAKPEYHFPLAKPKK